MKKGSLAALLVGVLLAAVACNAKGDDKAESAAAVPPPAGPAAEPGAPAPSAAADTITPADFSTTINNLLFPVSSLRTVEFSGTERDADGDMVTTRSVKRLLEKTDTVGGVTVAVVEVKDYDNGELVELTEDYFAQHRDGSVWYFGERVTNYEDGKVIDHEGQWLAGEGNNKPGLFMPANPAVGQEFEPERAPGLAEERSKVVELAVELTVPAGSFTGCVKVEEFDSLDKKAEFKFYCPRVGLVRGEGPAGSSELVRLS